MLELSKRRLAAEALRARDSYRQGSCRKQEHKSYLMQQSVTRRLQRSKRSGHLGQRIKGRRVGGRGRGQARQLVGTLLPNVRLLLLLALLPATQGARRLVSAVGRLWCFCRMCACFCSLRFFLSSEATQKGRHAGKQPVRPDRHTGGKTPDHPHPPSSCKASRPLRFPPKHKAGPVQ
jgi:hypothetical protein